MKSALPVNESQYRQMADALPQLVWIAKPDGYHDYFNKRWYEFTGTKPGETYGNIISHLLHPDDYRRTFQAWRHSLRTGEPYSIEYRIKRGIDGSYHWFLGKAMPVYNERGEITRWFGSCTYIQDLKEAQQEAQENHERYQLVNLATHDIIWDWNLITDQLDWNKAVEMAVGASISEMPRTAQSWHERIHPADRDRVISSIHEAIGAGKSEWNAEYRFGPIDGPWRQYYDRGFIARDASGKAYRMIGSMLDLTDRKEAEKNLRESEEQFRALITAGSYVVYRMSPNWTEMRQLNGQSFLADTEKPNKKWIDEYILPEDRPHVVDAINNAIFTKSMFQLEHRVIQADGSVGWAHSRAIPLMNEKGQIIEWIGAASDITARKKAEEEVRKSENLLRNILDVLPVGVFVADERGNITKTNSAAEKIWGGAIHLPIDRFIEYKGWWRHSGERVGSLEWAFARAFTTGEISVNEEIDIECFDGSRKTILNSAVPVKNEKGEIISAVAVVVDVTQKIKYEDALQESNELLRKAGELNENLLYIAAHDLKNPIANMQLALNLFDKTDDADKKLQLTSNFRQLVNKLENTIKGITEILQVHKADESVAREVYFEHVINEIIEEHGEDIKPAHLMLQVDFSGKESVKYIEAFLFSIIKNLINNSIKYCRDDVPLKIEVLSGTEGEYTVLIIKDNGIGIDLEKYGNQIFLPFKRIGAKKAEGTGIGLYIIKNIIEKNGGLIKVESSPGRGTTFYCYLKEY